MLLGNKIELTITLNWARLLGSISSFHFSGFILRRDTQKHKVMRYYANNLYLEFLFYFGPKGGVVYSRVVSMVMLQVATIFMPIFKNFTKFPLK